MEWNGAAALPSLGDLLMNSVLFILLDRQQRDQNHFVYVRYPHQHHIRLPAALLPPVPYNHSRIVVVSDTHDRHRALSPLPPCDLFVHCGDILVTGRLFSTRTAIRKLMDFNQWLSGISAREKVVIGGNHDSPLVSLGYEQAQKLLSNCKYLQNTSITFGSWRIWGTPYSRGRSPNRAFQSRSFRASMIESVPEEVDILITHGRHDEITRKVRHSIHLCGHNHNSFGVFHTANAWEEGGPDTLSVCAPIHDGKFRLTHVPVVIDVPNDSQSVDSDLSIFATPCADDEVPQSNNAYTAFRKAFGINYLQRHKVHPASHYRSDDS